MKKYIVFLILLYSLNGFAQNIEEAEKPQSLGTQTSMLLISGIGVPNYSLHFTIDTKKNFFSIGPLISRNLDLSSSYYYGSGVKNGYTLNGFILQYRHYPNSKAKVFDFFFHNQFIFQYFKDKGEDGLMYYGLDSYKSQLINTGNFIGYGFDVKFLKHFYVSQSVSAGIFYYNLTQDYENIDDIVDKYHSPGFIINFGIGYRN